MPAKRTIAAILVCVIAVGTSTPCHAINLTFINPAAGTNYAIGATITYSGSLTWTATDPGPPSIVQVELRYNNPNSGTIVDSESAIVSLDMAAKTGSFTNANPASITAGQSGGHSQIYFLVGTPSGANYGYPDPVFAGEPYRGKVVLGRIN